MSKPFDVREQLAAFTGWADMDEISRGVPILAAAFSAQRQSASGKTAAEIFCNPS